MYFEWYDIVGYAGAAILLTAFGAQQAGKLSTENILQPLLNFTASVLIALSLFYRFNPSAFIIQVFWIVFSIVAFVRIRRKKA